MSKIVGIDLGTTNSLVGVMDAGFPVLIAEPRAAASRPPWSISPGEANRRWSAPRPSACAASSPRKPSPRSSASWVGAAAKSPGGNDRQLRRRRAGERTPVRVEFADRAWSPEEISAEILKKLKADVERSLGDTVTRAVITVPAYFNDAQRNATKEAGQLAGFEVERIVNEPTAAALAYGLDRLKRNRKSPFTISAAARSNFDLELNAGVFQVLSTNGNTRLGGDDIEPR